MNSLSAGNYSTVDPSRVMPDNWAYQSAQIETATISGEQSADIAIQTADGDKVTLSSEIAFESTAATYEALKHTGASEVQSQGQIVSARASSELELTVEGSLDAQEKKEIKAVLMNLFEMVKDFITGTAPKEEPHDFAKLSTISAVKAEFDMSATVVVAAQSSANYVAQAPVPEKPAIQTVKTEDRPAVSEPVDRLTDRMIGVVKDSGVDPSKILDRVNRRLAKLSNRFMDAGPGAWRRMRLRKQILDAFVSKLQKLAAQNDAEENIKKLTDADAENTVRPGNPVIVETTASASETVLNVARQDVHFEFEYSAADDR